MPRYFADRVAAIYIYRVAQKSKPLPNYRKNYVNSY